MKVGKKVIIASIIAVVLLVLYLLNFTIMRTPKAIICEDSTVYMEYTRNRYITNSYTTPDGKKVKIIKIYDISKVNLGIANYTSPEEVAIRKINIKESYKKYKPKTTTHLFYGLTQLKELKGLENLNMECVIDASYMFKDVAVEAKSILELDGMMDWDMSKVVNLVETFKDANININCSLNWKTDSLLLLTSSFDGYNGDIPDISTWETSNVKDMSCCFKNCNMVTLNLSNWSNENLISDDNMFEGCNNLELVIYGDRWKK